MAVDSLDGVKLELLKAARSILDLLFRDCFILAIEKEMSIFYFFRALFVFVGIPGIKRIKAMPMGNLVGTRHKE